MAGRKHSNLKKQAELTYLAKQTPGARRTAKEKGVSVGQRVLFRDIQGAQRFGVVKALHVRSIEIEQTAAGLLQNGENIVIREDDVPYANVLEVLGTGRLAEKVPSVQAPVRPPPKREGGYLTCDVKKCDGRPLAVLRILRRGIVCVCRDHYGTMEDGRGNPVVPYRFMLGGLIVEEWKLTAAMRQTDPTVPPTKARKVVLPGVAGGLAYTSPPVAYRPKKKQRKRTTVATTASSRRAPLRRERPRSSRRTASTGTSRRA